MVLPKNFENSFTHSFIRFNSGSKAHKTAQTEQWTELISNNAALKRMKVDKPLLYSNIIKQQERPAVADKPARKVCTVYVRAVGL